MNIFFTAWQAKHCLMHFDPGGKFLLSLHKPRVEILIKPIFLINGGSKRNELMSFKVYEYRINCQNFWVTLVSRPSKATGCSCLNGILNLYSLFPEFHRIHHYLYLPTLIFKILRWSNNLFLTILKFFIGTFRLSFYDDYSYLLFLTGLKVQEFSN